MFDKDPIPIMHQVDKKPPPSPASLDKDLAFPMRCVSLRINSALLVFRWNEFDFVCSSIKSLKLLSRVSITEISDFATQVNIIVVT